MWCGGLVSGWGLEGLEFESGRRRLVFDRIDLGLGCPVYRAARIWVRTAQIWAWIARIPGFQIFLFSFYVLNFC